MKDILCGVDLGGTKLALGLVGENGVVIDKTVVYDHCTKNEHEIILQIRDIIKNLLKTNAIEEKNLLGIGVLFPGLHTRLQYLSEFTAPANDFLELVLLFLLIF